MNNTSISIRTRDLLCVFLLFFAPLTQLKAQDPLRFKTEVQQLKETLTASWNPYKPTVLFTGSSSIRMWHNLSEDFPEFQVVNTGFGGSQASDLQFYLADLVLAYNPLKVFIYEGDNDLASGKSVGQTLKDLRLLVKTIHSRYPGLPVVLIGAKPSISRWNLKGKYQRFNRKLMNWTKKQVHTSFADVWKPMLSQPQKLNETLFISDGLHMNAEGYQIWKGVIGPFLY
ncbi:MAG: hypothetical protein RLZZ241_1287 [Bacteroidota bacterium]|jgi:lysophospholipase L1-like esterase